MSLTINSFKNMDFFKILEKLKELNPKFDYKSNSIIADEFKIKFIPFENIIVISSLKNGESIKFANKTLDCLSGLVSDDVLFNLMENYDIEELFKKKSINEELFENLKKLKNDSDTYVSKLMEKYEDGLTVEERNKIKEEIKSYNDLVELCDNSMLVKTGDTSVEYEYKKFRFGIIISEPAASMRLNKAFLLQAFAFNLDNNLITKTYYITYEEAVNLGFDPESMKNILNSQVTKSMEYIKAFGISQEIRQINLVKEFNRLEYYHKKGVIYDSTYNYVKENLYYDKEEIIEESVNKKELVKDELVKEEVFDLLKSKNGVDKFLSSAKFITSGKKSYSIITEYYYVQYNYKGCKIDIDWDLLVCSIKNLLLTVSIDIDKLTDLYYKDVIKLGFPEKEIIDSIYKKIINVLDFWIEELDEVRKKISITDFLSNSKIMGFLYENKNHKEYERVMKLISLLTHEDDELYEGINLSEKRATKEDIKNEVFELLKSENGVDKFLSSAKFITSGKKSYSKYKEDYYVRYNYKGCKIDIYCNLLVYILKNLLLTVSIDGENINKLVDLYYKDVIKLGFPEKEIIDSIYKDIINKLNIWIEDLDEIRKNILITGFLSNSKIMGFLYENKKHKDYEKVMKLISLFEYKDDELYEEINLSEKKDVELEKLETKIKKQELYKKRIKNEVAELLKTEEGIDKFLSSAKRVDLPPEERTFNPSSSEELIYYTYKNVFLELYTSFIVDESTNIYVSELYYDEFLVPYKGAIKLGFDKEKVIDGIYEEILDDLQYEQIDDEYYKLDKNERIKRVSSVFNNQDIMKFLNENKNHKDYEKVIHILKSVDNITLYESDYSDSISEKENNLKILDEVKELFQTSDGIDKFLSSAKLVENNNISSTLFLCNIKYIYKNTEIRINFISLGNPDLSYKNIFFTNLRIDCKDSMFFVDLYYKEAIRLGFDKQKIVDYIYLKLINDIQYDSDYKSLNEFEKIKKISYILNNQEIINFLNDNKNNVEYERFMNIIKSLDYKKATNIINPVDSNDVLYEDKNNSKENDISDEVAELLKTEEGIDKFLSSAKKVDAPVEDGVSDEESVQYIYNEQIIVFTVYYIDYIDYTKIYVKINNKKSLVLSYNDAVKLGFDKQNIVDYIYMKLIGDIQHDRYYKSLNEFEKIKKISYILNNQEIINFLNDNKNNVEYERFMNIIKSLDYKKATNIINPVDDKDVLYENKNNSKVNNIPDEVVKLLNSKKGIDKFLSEAEFDYKTTTKVNYKYKNKTVSIGIELYNLARDFDKVILRVGHTNRSNSICPVYYKDAIRLGFRKKIVIDHLFEKFFKLYNWYIQNKCYSELINDKVIKFLNDNKTHKDYRKAMRIIKHPYRGEGTIYESKDEKSLDSYPLADYNQTRDVIELLSSKDGVDKFMSEAEILKRYTYGNHYLYKNNIYEFQISPKYDIPTKIYLNNFYSITGGILGLPYTEVIKLGFDENIVVDMVYDAILGNIELYNHSMELFNDEVVKFVLTHKNHKYYKTVKNYLEKVIVSYGNELLESKNETTDDTLKELHEFNTFMESSFGIDKFLSKAKLLKSNEEEIIYQYKNGIYHLYICPWWYDYKMKNLFIIEIGYERYSENLELKYTNNLFMDYRNAIKLGFNKDKVIKTIYDKIYRFLDDLIKKDKKIEFYNENELNEIMKFLEMSIDYSKEYQEAYNIVKNYITGKSPEEDEMIFESKRK